MNPKNTIGIVSRAVKPSDMTLDTVLARGGASISLHQYAPSSFISLDIKGDID
jgi:hypothetical protein